MDIVITIPKTIDWEDYEKELQVVEDGKFAMYFKVPHLPKRTSVGDRCYICYKDRIVGYMLITDLLHSNGFQCTTTRRFWDPGNYICRSGKFYSTITTINYKSFQGFRYAPDSWRHQEFK